MTRAVLFAIALSLSAAVHAQVHKCVSAAGKVSYTQDPCPADTRSGAIERQIGPAPAQAAAPDASAANTAKSQAPKSAADEEQAYRKRQQDQAKADKDAAQKAALLKQKQDNCNAARNRLATFEAGGRISRINAAGEREYYEDSQIEQEKENARQLVQRECN